MSRTYRQRDQFSIFINLRWVLRDHDACPVEFPVTPQIDPKSKEGKKRIAKFYADKTFNFKEPGPHWFRNLNTERPQRREAKRQLGRYMRDPEFVVILNAKDPLDYWT